MKIQKEKMTYCVLKTSKQSTKLSNLTKVKYFKWKSEMKAWFFDVLGNMISVSG